MLRDISTIKPDPNQPRKIFDEKHIQGLMKSISQEGLINPIEIDENGMIITGECRWRASKALGLKEVPVTINKSSYGVYERLRHQMAENVHQSGSTYDTMMNPIDTAKGYAKLLIMKNDPNIDFSKIDWEVEMRLNGGRLATSTNQYNKNRVSIRDLADEIGIEHQTILEFLQLLDQPEYLQKAVEAGTPRTYIREAERAPEEVKEKIKKKIAKGDYASRDAITREVEIARRLPELATLDLQRQQSKESIQTNRILNGVSRLALALEGQPLTDIDVREKGIVVNQLQWLQEKINNYLN